MFFQVVVVDNHRACIGGLDLCFGRFDTHTHPLADAHPTHFARTLFPGQGNTCLLCDLLHFKPNFLPDYNNARVLDFQDVSNYVSNAVSIMDTARMPWHDVSCNSYIFNIC
jgi:phospholipase D1/2